MNSDAEFESDDEVGSVLEAIDRLRFVRIGKRSATAYSDTKGRISVRRRRDETLFVMIARLARGAEE